MNDKKLEKTDIFEDDKLKPHDILVEAHGEDDFYDKVFLISEIEKAYDKLNIGKIKLEGSYVERARFLLGNFMVAFKDAKMRAK